MNPMFPTRTYNGRCLYKTGKCPHERVMKSNHEIHRLCQLHREKANQNQRKLDMKKKAIKQSKTTKQQDIAKSSKRPQTISPPPLKKQKKNTKSKTLDSPSSVSTLVTAAEPIQFLNSSTAVLNWEMDEIDMLSQFFPNEPNSSISTVYPTKPNALINDCLDITCDDFLNEIVFD